MERQRPYVILKRAESADGFMAPATDGAYWLNTPAQNRLNHRWRTKEAALMVGSETYLRDRPRLTPSHYLGPQSQPIVVDRRARLSDVPAHWLHLTDCDGPADILQTLHERRRQSVIVEGGRRILDVFLDAGLYDEVRILRSPLRLGAGLPAPHAPANALWFD